MTIRHLYSISSAALSLLFSVTVFSSVDYCPKQFEILERDGKKGYKFVPRMLEKLYCTDKFEGDHFKIVHSTGDEAIPFDHSDKELIKRAANVYHHLTVARKFWVDEIRSNYVQNMQQVIVRLDITNAFSKTRHFKNAELEKNYNNAWTIPAGETPKHVKEKIKWEKEIWFSPMKKVESRKYVKSKGKNPVHQSLLLIKDPIIEYNRSALIYQGLGMMVKPTIENSATLDLALKRFGAIAIIYGATELTKHMDKVFVEKYHFIDTAMIPDIIYHEYAHIALSDTMKTLHSVPVIEGMADYFATRVANREKMYDGIKHYSNNRPRNTTNKSLYHPYLEAEWNATADFTLGMLWDGRMRFDKLNLERAKKGQPALAVYDELVYEAHFNLNEKSGIARDLTKSLLNACESICQSKRSGMDTFRYVFENRGMN